MKKLNKFYKWFKETPEGRTLYRGVKTFAYTFLGLVAVSLASSTPIVWGVVLGSALVAALGFTTDKGIREIKNNNTK